MRRIRMRAMIAASVALLAMPARAQQPGLFDSASEVAAQGAAICAAIVFDGQSFESQLDGRPEWVSVEPRRTGSSLATHAWRALTTNETYVMRLPNGGCSFSVERGDGEALRTRVAEALAARAPFELVSTQATREGRATRYGYCVREEYPRVMSMVAAQSSSWPVLVFNMFRASDRAPDFCVGG